MTKQFKIYHFLILLLILPLILDCGRESVLLDSSAIKPENTPTVGTPTTGGEETIPPPDGGDDGDGVEKSGEIDVSAYEFNFDGEGSKDLTITNNGDGELVIEDITIDAPDSFTKEGECGILEAGENCSISVKFAPLDIGEKNGSLLILSDDPDKANLLIDLKGVKKDGSVPTSPAMTGEQNNCGEIIPPTLLKKPIMDRDMIEMVKFEWDGGVTDKYVIHIMYRSFNGEWLTFGIFSTRDGNERYYSLPLIKFRPSVLYKYSVASTRAGCATQYYRLGSTIRYVGFKITDGAINILSSVT